MTENLLAEQIMRQRYHGLYLSRQCSSIESLSRELLGLHCWFHRNVVFSALIRSADISGWKHALTKTWILRGSLNGVMFDDLPQLLSLHKRGSRFKQYYGEQLVDEIADEVIRCMEDGTFSRAEMRKLFSEAYDHKVIDAMFSPWGGIFIYLAGLGLVAFRDMTSRDFDLIDAEPIHTPEEVLPEILRRYFQAYGPATLEDAVWFLGFHQKDKKVLFQPLLDEYERFEFGGAVYYHCGEPIGMADIPEVNLLSGFDPLIVSYKERSMVLPAEYRQRVILKSGICLPTIAVNGKVAGLWNIKNGVPVIEFFAEQPGWIADRASELVDDMRWRIAGKLKL